MAIQQLWLWHQSYLLTYQSPLTSKNEWFFQKKLRYIRMRTMKRGIVPFSYCRSSTGKRRVVRCAVKNTLRSKVKIFWTNVLNWVTVSQLHFKFLQPFMARKVWWNGCTRQSDTTNARTCISSGSFTKRSAFGERAAFRWVWMWAFRPAYGAKNSQNQWVKE